MEGLASAERLPAHRVSAAGRFAVPLAVALWIGAIVVAWAWGTDLRADSVRIALKAPPLFGEWDLRLDPRLVLAAVAAGAVAAAGPAAVRRMSWRGVVLGAFGVALLWPLALALAEGFRNGVAIPLEGPSDYLVDVTRVGSTGEFLSTFTDRIDGYATHVRSHPPGMVLLLFGLDRAGLGGSTAAALLILTVAASGAVAALLALRAVAGEESARRAAPFLALAPAAVWIATTADALFMGVGAWAVALTVLAICAEGRRSMALAAGGGLLFGVTIFLSFGLVLLGVIPLAVAIARRRALPLVLTSAGALAVVGLFALGGYWWLDGFAAAREQYLGSVAKTRPYEYFLLANLAAFGLAIGVAAVIGLARLRDPRVWLLAGGGLAAVLIADVSGMSKAEVERIWLPFVPWVMVATAALPTDRRVQAALLGAQAALAIAIEAGVRTIW